MTLSHSNLFFGFSKCLQGDFVLSQLLQWYNGGIGQSPGLPNETLGCIRLPAMSGLWDRQVPDNSKAKTERPTPYETKVRRSLIGWFSDPHKRGSPWPDNVTAAFSCNGSELLPRDTSSEWIPLGSPILDLLVTGDDTNISSVLDEFGADESRKEGASNGLLDEGRPAQAVSNWVQCERYFTMHVDCCVCRPLILYSHCSLACYFYFSVARNGEESLGMLTLMCLRRGLCAPITNGTKLLGLAMLQKTIMKTQTMKSLLVGL